MQEQQLPSEEGLLLGLVQEETIGESERGIRGEPAEELIPI